ncbi:MAG: hypothetical protein PHD51_00590 [Patescibacteria group bacterium]|nr:hypothetical protein [Patescibacteria group bacterium]MDD5490636.1 hypothetical protein [Patescibacteria group bacterium]
MDFLTKFNLKISSVLKIAGLALLAIIIIVIAFRLVGSSFNSIVGKPRTNSILPQSAPSYDYASDSEVAKKYEYSEEGSVGLSVRNVGTTPSAAPIYGNGGATGDEAEEFEVTKYNATIETRQLEETCATVAGLKAREDVIFENASEYDHGCGYVFKAKRDKANEVLAIIKGLDPKELSENTYTIKKLIDDFTSEVEILEKKLASIDETLKKAVSAYDDISALATRVQDVESLAKIIDSKINIIERLTQERININSQLEQIERSKAEQLDRLEYTYFRVDIFESKFVDLESLKDSWKAAIKEFVRDCNQVAQDITVNLVALLLHVLQFVIYLLILLVIAKYGWQLVKYIWKK